MNSRKAKLIAIAMVLMLSLACVCGGTTPPAARSTEDQVEDTEEPDSPTATYPPVPQQISAERLMVSPQPGDDRLWAFLAESSEIVRSDDGGHTWPVRYSTTRRDSLDLWPGRVAPVGNGDQLYVFECAGWADHLCDTVFYYEGSSTFPEEIPSPIDAEELSFSDVSPAPDGSGRLVAVGGDPKGRDNAWLLDGPGASWQPISAPIDEWATIVAVTWLADHGLWAYNEAASILRADGAFQWEFTGTHGTGYRDVVSPPSFWSDASGVLRFCEVGGFDRKIFHWAGTEWLEKVYPRYEYSNHYPPPTAVLPGVAIFAHSYSDTGTGFSRSLDDGDTWEDVPLPDGLPARVSVNDLAVVGDVVYLATDMGLYISKDAGDSWEPVVE